MRLRMNNILKKVGWSLFLPDTMGKGYLCGEVMKDVDEALEKWYIVKGKRQEAKEKKKKEEMNEKSLCFEGGCDWRSWKMRVKLVKFCPCIYK